MGNERLYNANKLMNRIQKNGVVAMRVCIMMQHCCIYARGPY